MKAFTSQEIDEFLRSLQGDYDVRAPVSLPDGTRALARLDAGPLALEGGPVPGKPTSVFFPQRDRVFTSRQGRFEMQQSPPKPLLVVGLTAQDAESLAFTDRFFAAEFRDDVYFNRRAGAAIVVVSGRCGKNGSFLKIARGNCDLEFICDGPEFIAAPYSDVGAALAANIAGGRESSSLPQLQRESDALPSDDQQTLERASELLLQDRVPDDFWQEIAERCIACTACNLVCPTCTCFDVFDWTYPDRVERHRVWDSCQLDGFMREASGHNPMGEPYLRTRRRIHHKLAADVTRWGTISCFLCGRCDDVCPTGIGIKAVTRQLVARYG
jgi:sulfhydrogenase subunit beta (sulfur reductase)